MGRRHRCFRSFYAKRYGESGNGKTDVPFSHLIRSKSGLHPVARAASLPLVEQITGVSVNKKFLPVDLENFRSPLLSIFRMLFSHFPDASIYPSSSPWSAPCLGTSMCRDRNHHHTWTFFPASGIIYTCLDSAGRFPDSACNNKRRLTFLSKTRPAAVGKCPSSPYRSHTLPKGQVVG